MATIEKKNTKNGISYKITVSNGYDITGKQIRERTTYTPTPGMTSKQIEKELKQVKEIDDALLYHEFLHFTGEKLFDSEPIIKSNPDFSFVPFSEAEKKFLALFKILS